jgi:hypothetical protein
MFTKSVQRTAPVPELNNVMCKKACAQIPLQNLELNINSALGRLMCITFQKKMADLFYKIQDLFCLS